MHLKDENDYDPSWATKARTRAPIPEAVDVAIIGAGLGGLTAGAYLSRAGFRVAVFDQHYVAGGCCTQFSRGGPEHRYNFDIGLHYIGDCQAGGKIPGLLDGVGIELDYVPMDQDGFDTLVFPDFQFRIPAGHDRFRDRLVEMFPAERKGIDRYVRFLKEIDGFQVKMAQARGQMGPGMAFWALAHGRLAAKYREATLKDFLDSCTTKPEVQAVMAGQNGDYGLPPSKVSAALHAGLTNHYFKGAYYPRGGGQVIADRLSTEIEDAGGSVHLRKSVVRIQTENDRANGILVEGHRGDQHFVQAKVVLSNADLRVTFDQLLEPAQVPESWQSRMQDFEMAAAIFMTCLGIKGDMSDRGMATSNYWQFDSYDFEDFYRSMDDLKPRGCYITSASMKDPQTTHHAPAGISNLEVMTVLSGRASDWDVSKDDALGWSYRRSEAYLARKAEIEKDLIGRVDRLFPGSAEDIDFCESATPVTHTRYTLATDGTGYGLAATPDQFFAKRPSYASPVAGLYLAGASTRSGHGVVGSMESGYKSARRIGRELGVEIPDLPG